MKKIVEHKLNIQSDYQFHALHEGNFFQRQWHRNRLLLIRYLSFLSSSDSVADVGCGSGNVVLEFNKNVRKIVGFDYNDKALEFLKVKIVKDKMINADVAEFDILSTVPVKYHHCFDKIILNEVIEHFDERDIAKVLTNLSLMLRTDGKILITTPNYQLSPWPVLEFLIDRFNIYPSLWGEQHKIKFTPKRLSVLCHQNGFSLVRIGTFSLISPFLALFGQSPADWIAKMEIRHLKIFGPQIYAIFRKSKGGESQ